MKAADEVSQLLDDHIVMTQAMSFSPFKKPFENRIMTWESKLRMTQVCTASLGLSWKHYQFLQRFSVQWTCYCYHWYAKSKPLQDVMEEWVVCQRAWLYLEPIFSSEDINRQLPVESKRYQTMDRMWRKMMATAATNPNVRMMEMPWFRQHLSNFPNFTFF